MTPKKVLSELRRKITFTVVALPKEKKLHWSQMGVKAARNTQNVEEEVRAIDIARQSAVSVQKIPVAIHQFKSLPSPFRKPTDVTCSVVMQIVFLQPSLTLILIKK